MIVIIVPFEAKKGPPRGALVLHIRKSYPPKTVWTRCMLFVTFPPVIERGPASGATTSTKTVEIILYGSTEASPERSMFIK